MTLAKIVVLLAAALVLIAAVVPITKSQPNEAQLNEIEERLKKLDETIAPELQKLVTGKETVDVYEKLISEYAKKHPNTSSSTNREIAAEIVEEHAFQN